MSDDRRLDRLRRNEEAFRHVNERIAEIAEPFVEIAESETSFVCECARMDCIEAVPLSLAEYREVRARPDCFLVIAGHEDDAIEEVLERRAGSLVVVRKRV